VTAFGHIKIKMRNESEVLNMQKGVVFGEKWLQWWVEKGCL